MLAFNACPAFALIAVSLAVGPIISIMLPTIVSLACDKLDVRAADGSGIINLAICGGAIGPVATGGIANTARKNSLRAAVPGGVYGVIPSLGLLGRCRRRRPRLDGLID